MLVGRRVTVPALLYFAGEGAFSIHLFLGPSTKYTQLYRKLMAAVFHVVFMYFWNVSNLVISSLAHDSLEMGPEMGRLLDLGSISALPRILVGSEPG